MKWATILLAAALLGGCSLTREIPPSQSYTLQSAPVAPVAERCGERVLRIALLRGPQWLEGTAIHYAGTDGKTYTYTQSRWQQPPLEQLQQIVERGVIESGLFSGVIPYKSLAKNDLLLEVRVERMAQAIDAQGRGETQLMLYAVLVDQYDRRILAQKLFRYEHTSETGDAQSAVDGWNEGVGAFVPALIAWLQQECKAHPEIDRSDVDL